MLRSLLLALVASASLVAAEYKLEITPEIRQMLDRISADSMKGNLSFLASDLLEGRATPSRGLDLAAEFIASQYRRAGLEPGGDDGYFQTAKFRQMTPATDGLSLTLTIGDKTLQPAQTDLVPRSQSAYSAVNLSVFKAGLDLSKLKPEDVQGKALVLSGSMFYMMQALDRIPRLNPAVVLLADANVTRYFSRPNLVEMSAPPSRPMIAVKQRAVIDALKAAPEGNTGLKLSVNIPASKVAEVALRNVVAVVRGSDPALRDTAIVVSAHYDHIGVLAPGDGDRINNGANDDGSGTVSVVEIAAAMAKMSPRPRRSVIFVTFFGEEIGGYGSKWFGKHPPFPAAKIVGNMNLEQVGRTDASNGPQINAGSITGFDYSDLPDAFVKAGELLGVRVFKDDQRSDAFFGRSDNQALANEGIPAHTLCVAFEYPDYHRPGDHWDKIDYENMARVDRMVALGVLMLAQSDAAPKWNTSNPKTEKYVEAAKKLHTH